MVDPYPVPNSDASTVASALQGISKLGKTTIMVPQAFGGGEWWARSPSAIEERLMTYIGYLNGVSGIQYFVRNPEQGFPNAESAWSEIRQLAAEAREFESALMGVTSNGPIRVNVTVTVSEITKAMRNGTADCKAQVGAWEDRDGSILVLVAEFGKYDGLPCTYDFHIPPSCGHLMRVVSVFEDRLIADNLQPCCANFSDTLRSHATGAFRIVRQQPQQKPPSGQLALYNPGYEIAVNAAVPDGNYPGIPSDIASTFFRDSRLSTEGLHSLRFHTTNSSGVVLKPYRFQGTVQANKEYQFSIDVRGAKGGEIVGFQFTSSLFVVEDAQAGAADTYVAVATNDWAHLTIKLKGASTGGASTGWLSYGMRNNGDVWLDNMQLIEVSHAVLV